jgi:hypothetical protein
MLQDWFSLAGGLVLLGDGVVLALVQLTVVSIQWQQPGMSSFTRRGGATLAIIGGLTLIGLLIWAVWQRYRRRSL